MDPPRFANTSGITGLNHQETLILPTENVYLNSYYLYLLIAQELQVFQVQTCRDKTKANLTIATRSQIPEIMGFVKELLTWLATEGGVTHYGTPPPPVTPRTNRKICSSAWKNR